MTIFSLELNTPHLLSFIIGITIFLVFSAVALISYIEKEKHAALRAIFFAPIFSVPYLLIAFIRFPFSDELSWILASATILFAIVILLPIDFQKGLKFNKPDKRIDERDVMFSRNELVEGTEKFEEYYKRNPDKKILDDKFRRAKGLLMPGSAKYDPYMFASANATFDTIEAIKNKVDGEIAEEKIEVEPNKISKYIKNWAAHLGAVDCGITKVEDYHLYSYAGRGERYGNEIVKQHKYAVAFIVEMDFEMVKRSPAAPIVMESSKQYLQSGIIAVQVAEFIRRLGYKARAHIDGNYHVVCPLVARDAVLGEIGRMGLLMNEKLGPRLRISVVTTDMPLQIDDRKNDPTMIDFCMKCKKCAVVCPSRAIPFHSNKDDVGIVERWRLNQEECFTYWCKTGTDCGRCLAVCPYSHPHNLMHNFVRWGIKNSYLFRTLAVKFDDLLYGKRPPVAKLAEWMKMYNEKT